MTRPCIGVLMLDTAFPRIPGDVGNPESYPMPVRLEIVEGADVTEVVRGEAPCEALADAFCRGAQRLEQDGAAGIVTSCGFLAHVHTRLAAAVSVPLIASALQLGPLLRAATGGRRIGVLTADATALSDDLLACAGLASGDVAVAGMETDAAWRELILSPKADQAREIDRDRIERLAVGRAEMLLRNAPDIGCILLECGNLPPYAEAIRAATGKPVFHILDAARLLWHGSINTPSSVSCVDAPVDARMF